MNDIGRKLVILAWAGIGFFVAALLAFLLWVLL